MANSKISALPNASALGGTEQIPAVQSGGDVNLTPAQLKTFLNPMTTAGDIIIGGASGAQTRLGVGSNTQVLTVNGGAPTWQPAAGGGGGSPTGSAGGDLTGSTYPNPTVATVGGVTAANVAASTKGLLASNTQNTNYTFVLSDAGKAVCHTDGSSYTYTIPPHSSVAYGDAAVIVIDNNSSVSLTLAVGAGVTLYHMDGTATTGSFAIPAYSMCSIRQSITSDYWYLGAGSAGGGTPGGSNTQVQFNNSGAFGGSANLTFSGAVLTVGVQGTVQGSIVLGNTNSTFSTTLKSSNSTSAAWSFTFPTTAGTNGYLLQTDGSGVTSWVAQAGGGNVSNSGTPTNGQLAQWTNATTVQGITTGTGVATALGSNAGASGGFALFSDVRFTGFGGSNTAQNANYTFLATDVGRCVRHTDSSTYTYTIDTHANAAIAALQTIVVTCESTGTLTIAAPSGGSLIRLDGTAGTGNRTVGAASVATLINLDGSNAWGIWGTALS